MYFVEVTTADPSGGGEYILSVQGNTLARSATPTPPGQGGGGSGGATPPGVAVAQNASSNAAAKVPTFQSASDAVFRELGTTNSHAKSENALSEPGKKSASPTPPAPAREIVDQVLEEEYLLLAASAAASRVEADRSESIQSTSDERLEAIERILWGEEI